MFKEIIRDPWTYIATVGTVVVQWVMTHGSTVVGLLMGVGGIITIGLGIKEKIKKNKLLDLEIAEEEERKRERREERRERMKQNNRNK